MVSAARPHMPGYGVRPSADGSGLLPWSWAEERLTASHDYWVGTVWPDGRPHLMPVWGAWSGDAFWFSSAAWSRKVRNLTHDPRCTVATDDALDPVVVDGTAEVRGDEEDRQSFLGVLNAKYGTDYGLDFLDGVASLCLSVRPVSVFGLRHDDFTGSPTRWTFTAAG